MLDLAVDPILHRYDEGIMTKSESEIYDDTRGERREKRRRNGRKMGMSGKSFNRVLNELGYRWQQEMKRLAALEESKHG